MKEDRDAIFDVFWDCSGRHKYEMRAWTRDCSACFWHVSATFGILHKTEIHHNFFRIIMKPAVRKNVFSWCGHCCTMHHNQTPRSLAGARWYRYCRIYRTATMRTLHRVTISPTLPAVHPLRLQGQFLELLTFPLILWYPPLAQLIGVF